jgi:hypothetical protein
MQAIPVWNLNDRMGDRDDLLMRGLKVAGASVVRFARSASEGTSAKAMETLHTDNQDRDGYYTRRHL